MISTLPLLLLTAPVTLAEGPTPLRMMLLVHVLAAAVGLVTGYVALFAAKGSKLHRTSGMGFVYSMVTMSVFGAVVAVFEGKGTWAGALLTAYLVITALTTVRPPAEQRRWLQVGCMLVAAGVGIVHLVWGFDTIAGGHFTRQGVPAPMLLFMGTVAVLAAASDVRVIRAVGLHGRPRLVRHLWRMCFAVFIAAGSFFISQAHTFPRAARIPALLALPVLVPLLAMPYWIWRLRRRRPARGVVGAGQVRKVLSGSNRESTRHRRCTLSPTSANPSEARWPRRNLQRSVRRRPPKVRPRTARAPADSPPRNEP